MKKIVPLLLALCVLLSVSACKKDTPTTTVPSQITPSAPGEMTNDFISESIPEATEPAAVYHVGDTVSTTYVDFTLEKAVFCEALSKEEYDNGGFSETYYTLPAAYDPNADQIAAPLNQKFAYIEFSLHNKDRNPHTAVDSGNCIIDKYDISVNYAGVTASHSCSLEVLAAYNGRAWYSQGTGMEPDQTVLVKAYVQLENPMEDTTTPIDLVIPLTEPIDYGETTNYTFALNY